MMSDGVTLDDRQTFVLDSLDCDGSKPNPANLPEREKKRSSSSRIPEREELPEDLPVVEDKLDYVYNVHK